MRNSQPLKVPSVPIRIPNLRDGGVLDVHVDQGEVLAGVAVHQVDELGVAADGRNSKFDQRKNYKMRCGYWVK